MIDGITGLAIANAQFSISGGNSANTDEQGIFILNTMARGSYDAQLKATGYQSQTISFDFVPGMIGNLGDLKVYPVTEIVAPTQLTIVGQVVDGVSGKGISGANIQSGSITMIADDQGRFVLNDLISLDVELQLSANGYSGRIYNLTASGFGEVQQTFTLPPAITDSGQTASSISGVVKDSVSGLPIVGATVRLSDGSLTTSSNAAGEYTLTDISSLAFGIQVFATSYLDNAHPITLETHGRYTLDITLESLAHNSEQKFQIVSLNAQAETVGGDGVSLFTTTIENLTDQAIDAMIIGDIVNASNERVATLSPLIPGTLEEESYYSFSENESKELTISWNAEQNSPETYRLILRVIEPGTINQALPTGVVWAEDEASMSLHASATFTGTPAIQPPITQAGAQIPVALDALLVNDGNVPLSNQIFQLTISHPDTGGVLHQATTVVPDLGVTEHVQVSFGEWIPSEEGDLPIIIQALDTSLQGTVEGQIYVGDKASGTFTVDKTVVPEGKQTIQANIKLEGVDTAIGTITDPLFFAVKNAVTSGGEYTAREAIKWHKRSRCLGCHTQTQSLVGVASAYQKGLGDKQSANILFNTVSSSQQNDGGLRANHPMYTRTQTALGLWSLTVWDDIRESFKTLYKAAKHMYDRRSQSGNQTWWRPDHVSGWWYSNESHTAMTVKAYVHLLESAQTTDLAAILDYSLQSYVDLDGAGTDNYPLDLESGNDGLLYSQS